MAAPYVQLNSKGYPVAFQVHGQLYLLQPDKKGCEDKLARSIPAGVVQMDALLNLIQTGNITLATLEHVAVACVRAAYDHISFGATESILPVYGNEKLLVSTKAGSLAIATDMGGLYNLVGRDPRCVFRFKQFLDKYPCNYGIATIGSRAFAFYDKLGYDLEEVDDERSLASLVRFNYKGDASKIDLRSVLTELGFTIWGFNDDTAVPVYSYDE